MGGEGADQPCAQPKSLGIQRVSVTTARRIKRWHSSVRQRPGLKHMHGRMAAFLGSVGVGVRCSLASPHLAARCSMAPSLRDVHHKPSAHAAAELSFHILTRPPPRSPSRMNDNYVALAIGLFLALTLVLGLCACSMKRERERALLAQIPVLLPVSVRAEVS